MKGLLSIAIMPAIYFGCIVATAIGVASYGLSSIPAWLPPIFAVLATIGAVLLGARLPQVLVTFVVIIAIFPFGLLYLIGRAARLGPAETLSILAAEPEASSWLLMLSPIVAATVTCIVARSIMLRKSNGV